MVNLARAPFQCLILPYIIEDEVIKYGVFKRSDHGFWQFISGGGEDTETPLEAAHRELRARIKQNNFKK